MKCVIFLLASLCTARAQTIEFVRPLHDISVLLSIKQERNLEQRLQKIFPVRTLRRRTHSDGKIAGERIIYDVIKQHGTKYAVVIFTGSWKSEASQLQIFRIEDGHPNAVYKSHSWHSNFSDSYHEIQSFLFGKENIILIKEGEMGSSPFVIASVFSFHEKRGDDEHEEYFSINDLTPKMPRLKAYAGFPLKALYAQHVKLEKNSDHLILQAADVEFSWQSAGISFWKYDKGSRKFEETGAYAQSR